MAVINKTTTSLRISGDSLVPKEISELFRCEPTIAYMKNENISNWKAKKIVIARTRLWCLNAEKQEPVEYKSSN